ncbi:MAG TPA: condensin subunit MukF [Polyangiaceae bacterium]|nr:condensin subunit MukF [Polyangiaceae bacterium]
MPSTPEDPNRALAALAERGVSLSLTSLDVCFAAALYLRANGEALTSFSEAELFAVFDDVVGIVEPGSDTARRRATPAIQRLREQRLLARVDGAGVVRSGEYALTRLATGIVEFYLHDETLTRESLTLLTRTLLASLGSIRDAASRAQTTEAWRAEVSAPLSVTVGDLVSGIERRQRGLDAQQEEFQREITALLQADWFGAVERCQALLEASAATLRELNEILMRDTHELSSALQEIQELAQLSSALEAEEAARRVADQIERIAAWGASRQRAWSEYYRYVHHFLRDVVRLDPTRALTERLREQLSGRRGRRFALSVANAPPVRVLRELKPVVAPPPVRRPRAEREKPTSEETPHDPDAELEARIVRELDDGAADLSSLTARITAEFPKESRFVMAGRIAQIVARLTRPIAARERPWVASGDDFELEEWAVRSARSEG